MISLDHAVVARLDSHGERFEILVDPRQAALVRQGQPVNIEDVVAALNVFGNSSKATRASDEALMKEYLGTGDIDPAAVLHVMREEGIAPAAMDEMLNQRSGLLGISGTSKDMRALLQAGCVGWLQLQRSVQIQERVFPHPPPCRRVGAVAQQSAGQASASARINGS